MSEVYTLKSMGEKTPLWRTPVLNWCFSLELACKELSDRYLFTLYIFGVHCSVLPTRIKVLVVDKLKSVVF